ncbi:MAG: SGNH/GDSL hydrolase family protein [Flavobacteriales bacterium]|nr:SGNH/GDSL hydrolase family protein [Flavobacteriales bacterium]
MFLLIFTMACVEIGARFYMGQVLQKSAESKFRFNYYRVYEHVPGFTEGDGQGDRMTIERNGFRRVDDVAVEKAEGTFRIFLLGGSAAHGISSAPPYPIAHVNDDETIDAHLEVLLKEHLPGRKVEVINAAVTGYQVFQHTQYLLSELLEFDPDLVIFFDGANDHYSTNPEHRYLSDFRYQFWKTRLQEPSFGTVLDAFAFWMSKYSGAFRGYVAWKLNRDAQMNSKRIDLTRPYDTDQERIEAHKQLSGAQYLRSMETNLFLLQREGVKAIICLQPMLVLRDVDLLSDVESAFLNKDPNAPVLYPTVLQELEQVSRTWDVPFVDMNPAFNERAYDGEQLFIDYCHLNSKGGQVCAEHLLPVVVELIQGPPMIEADSARITAPEGSGI